MNNWDFTTEPGVEIPADVEEILLRQDEAMALLERLRDQHPFHPHNTDATSGGRRDFRRWPTPAGVTLEAHDGTRWQRVPCLDMGVGGARIENLPTWIVGPVPVRLFAPSAGSVLVLADTMWRDARSNEETPTAGIRFEFQAEEERDHWAGGLIDALLAQQALR